MIAKSKYPVLIVDDDEPVLEMMSDVLSDLQYEILTAKSSEEAIRILDGNDVAVLICDLHMSEDMSGNDILERARAIRPDIISVLMSGRMDRDAMITALNRGGVSRYLEKPIDVNEVRSVIEEAITKFIRHNRPQERLRALARKTTIKIGGADAASSSIGLRPVRKEHKSVDVEQCISDRYRLMDIIGEGRTGTVYRAEDQFLNVFVALKMLRPELTVDEHEISVLKTEARIAMALSHKNIVRLHHFDKKDDNYFLVMEYLDGCSVRDALVQDGTFPIESVLLILRSCSEGLSYAHEHGVAHQDLKPENILISEDGIIKIIDFGLACLVGARIDPTHVAGTPIYMSPEQKRMEPVDVRTDIYSMGIILYELLTGQPPFDTSMTHMDVLESDPQKLIGLPDAMLTVLEKAIAIDATERWGSIKEFSNAFISAVNTVK